MQVNLVKEDIEWTKRETQMYQNPFSALAAAVIMQWNDDGCPAQDKEAIDTWFEVFKTFDDGRFE